MSEKIQNSSLSGAFKSYSPSVHSDFPRLRDVPDDKIKVHDRVRSVVRGDGYIVSAFISISQLIIRIEWKDDKNTGFNLLNGTAFPKNEASDDIVYLEKT